MEQHHAPRVRIQIRLRWGDEQVDVECGDVGVYAGAFHLLFILGGERWGVYVYLSVRLAFFHDLSRDTIEAIS